MAILGYEMLKSCLILLNTFYLITFMYNLTLADCRKKILSQEQGLFVWVQKSDVLCFAENIFSQKYNWTCTFITVENNC